MDREEVANRVLDLIEEICGDDIVRDEPDIDLFEEGLFDSLAAIEFLVNLEDEFGVSIAPTELEREQMNTPAKAIERVLERM